MLVEGQDVIGPSPARIELGRWLDKAPGTPGRIVTAEGGFLDDVEGFDAAFFGISPLEADRMDPQHRLALMVAWETLEDAAISPALLAGSNAGVFLGVSYDDYENLISLDPIAMDTHVVTGGARSILPARISFALDARGPSLAIDTACSASLVAIHLAVQSLRLGECPLALAGGVSVLLRPEFHIGLSRGGMLAADGRCKAFDARGDGFVRSEGVAMVALKRLSDAERDGDRIYALLRGTAHNSDGAASGFLLTPSVPAQVAVQQAALANAEVKPTAVSYVEAHGTGTRAGDPVEVAALAQVYGPGRSEPLRIGSVKTNIGHAEPAAAAASVIKTTLSLYHHYLPPSLHFREPNPQIPWAQIPVQVQTQGMPWEGHYASVNSFALGGQNAHAVLEAPPKAAPLPDFEGRAVLLPIAAHGLKPLRTLVEGVAQRLEEGQDLRDAAHTGARRSQHAFRLGVVATTGTEAAAALRTWLATSSHPDVAFGEAPERQPKVVFVFPGQGAQWATMGRSLYQTEPVFAKRVDQVDHILREVAGWSVVDEIHREEAKSRLDRLEFAQPTIFAVQVGLVALWESWGLRPDATVGHSMGEAAAATAAGALSLRDGIGVVAVRTRLIREHAPPGAMAAVELSEAEATALLAPFGEQLCIGAVNAPTSVILSGESAAIDEVVASLQARDVFARKVRVDCASHSRHMESVLPKMRLSLRDMAPQPGRAQFYSTVVGGPVQGECLDTEYWCRNLRQPVRFQDAIGKLAADGYTVFLEVGHHPMLLAAIRENLQRLGRPGTALAGLRRLEPERPNLLRAAALLRTLGVELDFAATNPSGGRVADWPVYPWHLLRHWMDSFVSAERANKLRAGRGDLLGAAVSSSVDPETRLWTGEVGPTSQPWLLDHRVGEVPIFPTTGHIELLLSAAREDGLPQAVLEDLEIKNALIFSAEKDRTLQVVLRKGGDGRRVWVAAAREDGSWERLLEARLQPVPGSRPPRLDLAAVTARLPTRLSAVEHQANMRARGLDYGPRFQALTSLLRKDGEVLGTLHWPTAEIGWVLHPGALDSALQAAAAALPDGQQTLLPVRIRRLTRWADTPPHFVHVKSEGACANLQLLSENGEVLIAIEGLEVRAMPAAAPEGVSYYLGWVEASAAPADTLNGANWLILTDAGGVGNTLAAELQACDVKVHTLPASSPPSEVVRALKTFSPVARLVDLGALDAAEPEAVRRMLPLVRALEAAPVQLTVVTAGAAFVPQAPRPMSIAQAAFVGLSRVIAAEYPSLSVHRLDMDPQGLLGLAAALRTYDREDEVALRDGQRFARRLLPLPLQPALRPAGRRSFTWDASRGLLACPTPQPGPNQVALRIAAAVASGESAVGVVTAVAPGVKAPRPGERVMVLGKGLRASDAVVHHRLCWPAPGELSDEEAAKVPLFWQGETATRVERISKEEALINLSACPIDPHATWLITGGLGGLGRVLATHLVSAHGVRGLVLIGRSAPADRQDPRLAWLSALERTGAVVRVRALDVADAQAVNALIDAIAADPELPPLRGVVHAAGVLNDGILQQLDETRLLAPFPAKIIGALHLHEATRRLELDEFILFSSAAGFAGSAGQAGYAAASAAVDALCWERARMGLPARAIAWGAWAEVGLAAQGDRISRLAAVGMGAFRKAEGAALFSALLRTAEPWVAALRMNLSAFRAADGRDTRLYDLLAVHEDRETPHDRSRLQALHGEALHSALIRVVLGCVGAVLQQPLEQISTDQPLRRLGLDSLTAVQLKGRLEKATGLNLPAMLFIKGDSPSVLATEIAERFEAARKKEAERAALAERVDELDDAAVDALLQELLQEGAAA